MFIFNKLFVLRSEGIEANRKKTGEKGLELWS